METSDNQINWDKVLDAFEGRDIAPLNAEEEALLKDSRRIARMVEMRKKFPGRQAWQKFVATRDGRATKIMWWTPAKKIAVAAAVLALAIAGGVWYHITTVPGKEAMLAQEHPTPVGKPFLHLSNGEKLVLDSNMQSVTNNGTRISASDSMISYVAVAGNAVRNAMDTLDVPRGYKLSIMLADGTKVWVNAESRMIFPASFDGTSREVTVEGEAYFDVVANSSQPFIVHASGMDVKVLGTAFNINTYERFRQQTTLISGLVSVSAASKQLIAKPGEQVCYEEGMMYKSAVNTKLYTAWKEDEIYFEDAPLLQITSQLGRTFDYEFVYSDKLLEKLNFTLDMQQPANLQQVLDRIHLLNREINFQVMGRTVTISR